MTKLSRSEINSQLAIEIQKLSYADVVMALRKRYRVDKCSKLTTQQAQDFLKFLRELK